MADEPADRSFRSYKGQPRSWKRMAVPLLMMKPNAKDLELIAKLLGRIEAKPLITEYNFNETEVLEGLEKLKSRRTTGKLVFNINSS